MSGVLVTVPVGVGALVQVGIGVGVLERTGVLVPVGVRVGVFVRVGVLVSTGVGVCCSEGASTSNETSSRYIPALLSKPSLYTPKWSLMVHPA